MIYLACRFKKLAMLTELANHSVCYVIPTAHVRPVCLLSCHSEIDCIFKAVCPFNIEVTEAWFDSPS